MNGSRPGSSRAPNRLVAPAISMTAAHCKFEQICPPVVVELPATDHVSNSVTMMADGWPMDGAVRSHNKRKRRSPKGARVRVSKGKGAPRSRRGGGAMRDKEQSKKKSAATAWHASFESNESSSAREADAMGRSLALAIAEAHKLELSLTGYELRQENRLSTALEAGRTDMLTWQQAEVIIQALEASVVTLAPRPLIGTEVVHPSEHHIRPRTLLQGLDVSSPWEIHMELQPVSGVGLNVGTGARRCGVSTASPKPVNRADARAALGSRTSGETGAPAMMLHCGMMS